MGSTTTVRAPDPSDAGTHLELDSFADGPLKEPIDLAVGLQLPAIDGQQKLARLYVDSRRRQGGTKAWVPEGSAVDCLEPVAAFSRLVVGAEQADGYGFRFIEPLSPAENSCGRPTAR